LSGGGMTCYGVELPLGAEQSAKVLERVILKKLKDRPAVLYKYLDATGANAFLEKPQLQHRAFEKLDDI
jgi:hypothetical protein